MQLRFAAWMFAAILGALPATAQHSPNQAPPPVSLERFASSNDMKSPGSIQFISLRCGALHLFAAGTLEGERPKMAAIFDESAKSFVEVAINVSKDSAFVWDQIKRMVEMYSERAKASKANTGNMFDDPIVGRDMAFCKLLRE